jgi:hypothetical protein
MILEYAQILSSAHRFLDGTPTIEIKKRKIKRWKLADSFHDGIMYQATHINHPSVVWARSSKENYIWLANLLISCCEEYTHRYNKTHKIEETGLCYVLLKNLPNNIPDVPFTEPPQAMPDECKVPGDSIQAYQNYYAKYKSRFAKWKNRTVPTWYSQLLGDLTYVNSTVG